ncbi:unnamed protein product [Gadus morhua 'NCC']
MRGKTGGGIIKLLSGGSIPPHPPSPRGFDSTRTRDTGGQELSQTALSAEKKKKKKNVFLSSAFFLGHLYKTLGALLFFPQKSLDLNQTFSLRLRVSCLAHLADTMSGAQGPRGAPPHFL